MIALHSSCYIHHDESYVKTIETVPEYGPDHVGDTGHVEAGHVDTGHVEGGQGDAGPDHPADVSPVPGPRPRPGRVQLVGVSQLAGAGGQQPGQQQAHQHQHPRTAAHGGGEGPLDLPNRQTRHTPQSAEGVKLNFLEHSIRRRSLSPPKIEALAKRMQKCGFLDSKGPPIIKILISDSVFIFFIIYGFLSVNYWVP